MRSNASGRENGIGINVTFRFATRPSQNVQNINVNTREAASVYAAHHNAFAVDILIQDNAKTIFAASNARHSTSLSIRYK